MRKYLLIILIISACSGKDERPKDVMPPKKMQGVLWDMMAAGEFYSAYINRLDSTMSKDSARNETYSKVLAIHEIDMATFKRSLSWYKQHPKQMAVILDSLSKTSAPNGWQNVTPIGADSSRRKLPQRRDIEIDLEIQ